MKFELTVTDEVLVELFLVDYADEEMQRRKQRLNRHTLLMNKSLRQYWEQKMTERGFQEIFSHWLPQAMTSVQKLKVVPESDSEAEEEMLLQVAENASIPLLIGDVKQKIEASHPTGSTSSF